MIPNHNPSGIPQRTAAVVGGGITGIAAALELVAKGDFQVTILEKDDRLGGLCSSAQWGNLICDRFYHVILPTDDRTVAFIKMLGLENKLIWKESRSGFYGQGKLVSFSSALDFIRFPFLSLAQKIRLGAGILKSSRIKDPRELEHQTAPTWLKQVFGQKLYELFWGPLLRSKLGEGKDRTSAAFICATINRLYGARNRSNRREKLGYVQGGYQTILTAAQTLLSTHSVQVMTKTLVTGLQHTPFPKRPSYRDSRSKTILQTNQGSMVFDRVLLTIPNPEILKIIKPDMSESFWTRLNRTEYLGVICLLVVLKQSLSPYYVINLLDPGLPFTGIIESTAVFSPRDFIGRHLVYLPKYLTKEDPLLQSPDDHIQDYFLDNLKKVFPDLKNEDILHTEVFREKYTQPIPGPGYIQHRPGEKTPIPGIYLANTSLIEDSTVNNNAAIRVAQESVRIMTENAISKPE